MRRAANMKQYRTNYIYRNIFKVKRGTFIRDIGAFLCSILQ